jgi:hypothetical protein
MLDTGQRCAVSAGITNGHATARLVRAILDLLRTRRAHLGVRDTRLVRLRSAHAYRHSRPASLVARAGVACAEPRRYLGIMAVPPGAAPDQADTRRDGASRCCDG